MNPVSLCHGPMSSECISCALSGQLLQDGNCVDDCIGHFYIADGYCLECNESCARCLKDGTCQFCEDSFYLEEEYCVPECTPGYYKFLDAYCLFVKGPSKDKCLTCSSGYLLPYIGTHFGNCVEECPAGYYLTNDGNCAACHESCKTCYGSNDTDCLSCSNSLFIKNGKCVPHCSNGFFQYGGICYACHPSCATCYGFNSDECYTCPFGRTFKYGKCISSCEEGKYMNTENLCSNCHASCSDCLLNRTEGEDLQCLQCKHQQLSILYGECVIDCPSNFYLNSYQICQECHPSCATCERNGATSCVTCWNGNFLTHLGTCEAQCHQGYFPSNGVCQACSSNCHHCIGASECLQCKGNLVLQFGECLPLCSDQHYIDGVSRQCTACDLKCKTCSISNKCISCDFPLLLRDGECVDDCGTGQYADYNTLTCKSCGLGCTYCLSSDECGLCKDGYHLHQFTCRKSCPENYFEDPMSRLCKRNYGAPSVYINSNLRVQAGSSILITSSVLNASHVDSEKLQLEDGWVFFKYLEGMPLQGDLVLKISDGYVSSGDIILPMQIVSKFAPEIGQLDYIVVPEESLVVINPSMLYLEDKDNIADDHVLENWFKCLSKKEISSITYEEFSKQLFAFKSFKTGAIQEDSFVIQAFDGFNSKVTDMKVIILPKVENRKSKKILNFDFEISPTGQELETIMQDNVYGMMVLQNHPAIISNDHLLIEVNGISPNSIVYMITKKLLKEEGFLENLNQPGVKLQSFTQNDVDSMKIVYHPPAYGGTAEKQFVFQFVVIDAGSGSQLSSIQNFTITVTPPIADLTSPASSIDHTSRVVVTQGQSVQFERNWFITDMHELSDDQLEVVITNTPQHGVLVQISGDSRTEVEEGIEIIYLDSNIGRIFFFTSIFNDMFYEHDGSFNFRDSAVFSIMGGKQSTLNRVLFEISPNDRESPVILDSTTLMGSVTEGKSLTLQRYHLAFTDLMSEDKDIKFTLLSMPKYGILEKKENEDYYLLKPKRSIYPV
ncbi:extracellular matrix protein FRAS1 [Caerostris extrusa]|uniref:Extracellular matrix protein FRAS1 n=1 Tax=Caerostris extrusa TaxID=172846 RepID=A0AAV4SV34_CAEEX|nr:extracellular matrix protein FRAS1 [Caerostris extrusa]